MARDLRPDESGNIISTAPPGSPPSNLERMSSRSGSSSVPSSLGRKEGSRHSVLMSQQQQQQPQPQQPTSNLYPNAKQAQAQGGYDTVDSPPIQAPEMPPPYSEACKGRCRAVYEYQARMPDELTIYPGKETNFLWSYSNEWLIDWLIVRWIDSYRLINQSIDGLVVFFKKISLRTLNHELQTDG